MIKRGDILRIKPEWADPGDDKIIFKATEDESKGRISIMAMLNLPVNPVQVVSTDMVEIIPSISSSQKS